MRLSPEGRIFIFLNEVQDIEGWERFVNSYSQDYTSEYRLFISGSNSKMLSSELSTLLTGRYLEFSIFPFSYSEYTDIYGLETGRDSYMKYMKTGGLPELGNLSGEEARRQYIEGLKNTILLKDIIQRHQVRGTNLLESLFAYLVNNASNLVSVQNIVNLLLDDTTIDREYSPLLSIPDNYEKYVVSLDDISLPVKDGIRNIPAWDLKKYI